MKNFACRCGQKVFFDSDQCVQCSALLGFDPDLQTVLSLDILDSGGLKSDQGRHYRRCNNAVQHDICNWLIGANDDQQFCHACRLNRIIPNLSGSANLLRWQRLEGAKRRLLYTVMALGLPVGEGLAFDFLEDGRSDPARYGDSRITSGYLNGVITINVLEADPVAREAERIALNEPQRTLLGHMRHESGHHYYSLLSGATGGSKEEDTRDFAREFLEHFGDPAASYSEALEQYYASGPPADWQMRFISPYATSHPFEDWAETWSHYLNMVDALETGASHNMLADDLSTRPFEERLGKWRALCTAVNELNRSSGADDVYPYVVSPVAANKLEFVERSIRQLQARC